VTYFASTSGIKKTPLQSLKYGVQLSYRVV
jgi:hypothetical protein